MAKTYIIKKKTNLEQYKNTKEKGDVYEKYILDYLYLEDSNRKIWLWSNIPEDVMCDVGLIGNWNDYRLQRKSNRINKLPDVGCDIFMIDNNNCNYLIQCKYYSINSVKIEDLSGWHGMLLDYPEMLGDLYYTSKLSENIKARKPNPRIRYFHKPYEPILETEKTKPTDANPVRPITKPEITLDYILGILQNETLFTTFTLKPHDYQLAAYNALLGKKRTVLQLPCGIGKTLIAIMLSDGEMLIIFISPLKAFCQQNMERFLEQLPEYKCVIVDSEGIRDIDELQTIVSVVGQKTALFATYKSLDVIMQLYDKQLLNNAYFIIDEFHNIPYDDAICYDEDEYIDCESVIDDSKIGQGEELNSEEEKLEDIDETDTETEIESNLEEENKSPMYRLLHSNARILFMSATPRLFEESDETAEGMDIDNELFGEVDYSYPMGQAINEGYICDYMIYVPTMAIPKDTGIDAVIEELAVKDFDKELLIKSRFIIRGCMGTGSRKCIIYCADQKECAEMMKMITELCKNYFAIDCWVDTITSVDSRDARKNKLKKFKDVRELAFLCSVDILNECVDIPVCDSIFITYVSKSRIRNIQRLCRANRKCAGNPNKVASIFLWCDEYAEMACFMKHLKEYDERFTYEKVKRICGSDSSGSGVMKVGDFSNDKKVLDGVIVGFKSVASWMENLEKVKKYIDKNGRRPTSKTNKELNNWIKHQITNFVKRKQIMKSDIIYQEWNNFINDARYKKYFDLDNIRDWKIKLEEFKQFIDTNNSRPTRKTNKELNKWIQHQITNSTKRENIMKINEVFTLWNEFINDARYKKYFQSNEEDWKTKLEEVKQFINTNNSRPTRKTNKELCGWIQTQITNSTKRENIMKINEVFTLWNEFINDARYKKYFDLDNIRDWKNKLEEIKEFISINKARPTENNNKELCSWL